MQDNKGQTLDNEAGVSSENILKKESNSDLSSSSGKTNCLSPEMSRQEGKIDSLSCKSKDGYSTEGTVGSETFEDNDDDIIGRLLTDNIDDFDVDCGNFVDVQNGRKSSLTPLSLEVLDSTQLDKRECVRSYLQAWSPLNAPNAGAYSNSLPGACLDIGPVEPQTAAFQSLDGFQSICDDAPTSPKKLRELVDVESQEFNLIYQHETEPVSRPLSDNWNLLKNDRAPWIDIRPEGSVIQRREGLIRDNNDTSWPRARADTWQDQNKGLTICSLSTINEESDDADRIDNYKKNNK